MRRSERPPEGTRAASVAERAQATLAGDRIVLRPATDDDAPRLAEILAEPSVASWWVGYDVGTVRKELADGSIVTFAIELEGEGETIGAVQYHETAAPSRHAAIDYFLTTARRRQGHGRDAIRVLARYLFGERGRDRLTIDPAMGNEHALRALASIGFRVAGVVKRYEKGPDGKWRDAILMELRPEDLPA